jgi:putative tricarboxylic transport membrane protein
MNSADEARRQREAWIELAVSAALLVLGAFVLWAARGIPSIGGFSGVGPDAMPAIVGSGLVLVGLWLLAERLTGGWRQPEPHPVERGEHAFLAPGFVWVSAGLAAQMLLINTAGFIIAATALFVSVARGFGSRRPLRDALLGFVISLAIFLFFVRFLNVGLPAGWLKPLVGAAGI